MRRSVRSLLRSQEGSTLVDSMVGVIVTAIVVTSVAGLAANITVALRSANIDTARSSSIHSLVNDLAAQPNAVSLTPSSTQRALPDTTALVTVWKTTPYAGVAVINAATSRYGSVGADCTNPATLDSTACLTASVSIDLLGTTPPTPSSVTATWSAGPVDGASPVSVPIGQIGSFTGTGKTSVSYVVQVRGASGPGAITFNAGAAELVTVPIDSLKHGATPQYVYGSVPVNGAETVIVNLTGTTASLDHFYIYEVAR